MKTKLLTAMIVCALLISLTGCAADKIASTPTQNVDVTMDTETAIESEGETEAVTLAAETAEKDIPGQTEAEKMVEDYNNGLTVLNDASLAYVDTGFGMTM